MCRRVIGSLLFALLLGGVATADEPDAQAPPQGRHWVDVEALLWWMRPANLPPLITASPPGTPPGLVGVPGTPGLVMVFGGSPVNGNPVAGGRVTTGLWLDCNQTCGVEAYIFELAGQAAHASAGSPGLVGRPFFNALKGHPDSELVAFPGILNGQVQAGAASGNLLGAGALARHNLCCGCDCWCGQPASYRLDALAGYRYLAMSDRVDVGENLTSTLLAPGAPPVGTNIIVSDSFHTSNQFHGLDLGLSGTLCRNAWTLTGTARVAFGGTIERADINGATTVTMPGFPPMTSPGGLLALSSNSGNHTRDVFGVVPEARIQLGYQVNPRVRVHVGYTFLFWSQIIRAGDQIDTVVNPALLPPVIPGVGPLRPAFSFQGTNSGPRESTWGC
jgi:hypothetical protein